MLDDITLYWLTNSAISSAQLYWENNNNNFSSPAQRTTEIKLPVAVTVFPGEIYRAPKSWTERAYPSLVYFNEVDKGGHFAAWEEPQLFAQELRAAFRSVRYGEGDEHENRDHLRIASVACPVELDQRRPGRLKPEATKEDTMTIRPFKVSTPEQSLVELRRRIAATQWPEKETVADDSQGVPLATMQKLARHWATDYDWRKCEARLNALPQFITEIDGLDIHFIHVRSKHPNALPLVVTHGWPGSIIEQLKIIGPLTDPTAFGGRAEDAFDVVIPSMPGYGFSGKPTGTGWGPERIGRAWAELMKRLGYTRYVAQGGDWGAFVVDQMGLQAPAGLLAIHTNMPATVPADVDKALLAGEPAPSGLSPDEKLAYEQLVRTFKQVEYATDDGGAPADSLRHRRLTGRAGRLASRPQRCGRPAGRGRRLGAEPDREHHGRADARRDPRQHHALLADEHRGLRVSSLLGVQGRLLQRQGCLHSGGRECVSGRAVRGAAELVGARLSQAHPLQPGRQRRPFRGVGRAPAVCPGAPRRVPVGALRRRRECLVNELLARVLDAHGGLERWRRYARVQASIVSGGGLFALKGLPQDPTPRRMTVWLHEQRASVAPFGAPDQRSMFTPERVAIEKLDGSEVARRFAPRDSFAGHQWNTHWDPLQRAYFNGEALWTYLTTPFLLAMEGVRVEETDPCREAGETWSVLRAYLPGSIESHCLVQDFYFGDDLLLRRHDYTVTIAGGLAAAQLTSQYAEANGIRLPTRRRAYARAPDGRAILDLLLVSIDIADVGFEA